MNNATPCWRFLLHLHGSDHSNAREWPGTCSTISQLFGHFGGLAFAVIFVGAPFPSTGDRCSRHASVISMEAISLQSHAALRLQHQAGDR